MINKAMEEKIESGEAIYISDCPREGRYYRLTEIDTMADYCDAKQEAWIWSIGQRWDDPSVIHASQDTSLYQNPDYECLFLR